MSALGRVGGKRSPGQGKAHQGKAASPERRSLREYLRREVDPAEVWAGLKTALESSSDTARVAAAKVLLTELYEPHEEGRKGFSRAEAEAASDKLNELLERMIVAAVRDADAGRPYDPTKDSEMGRMVRRAVARAREGREAELTAEIEKLIEKVTAGLRIYDINAEQAREILNTLAEMGLIRPAPSP